MIGLSGSYSSADIELDRETRDDIDLDVFQINAYAARRYDRLFINGQIGYAFADVSAERSTSLGLVTSDYDSDGITAQINATYDFALDDNGYFSPQVGLHYGNFSRDRYTENGGLDLRVEVDNNDYLEAKFGVITGTEHELGDGSVVDLFARVAYVIDLTDSQTGISARFGSQIVGLDGLTRDDERVELGAGVNWYSSNRFTLGASVDGELASNYFSVAGNVRMKYNF